jgi:hypothetical protein
MDLEETEKTSDCTDEDHQEFKWTTDWRCLFLEPLEAANFEIDAGW